jgi:multimeric flavodoxin WrbA
MCKKKSRFGYEEKLSMLKLLGLSCGRKLKTTPPFAGNTEVLVKEALMEAEKHGVDVEFIRMVDLDLKPCIHCERCLWMEKGPEYCPVKDDSAFLYDKIMECDGLILGAPVYTKTAPGLLKMFDDRALGPKSDVAFLIEAKKLKEKGVEAGARAEHVGFRGYIDERAFKKRVGGLISQGGSIMHHWLAFDLASLHICCFSQEIRIVDQMRLIGVGRWGHVVLNEKWLERARRLGRNVAEAMKKPIEEVKWMGDEPGVCPVCHLDFVVILGEGNKVMCPLCGITGNLELKDGKITVNFPEEEQKRSLIFTDGLKRDHWFELQENVRIAMQRPDLGEIPKKLEKYIGYGEKLDYKLWLKRGGLKE